MRFARLVGDVLSRVSSPLSTLASSHLLRRRLAALTIVTLAAACAAGCAQRPQQVAAGHGKEYFPSSVYGAASPRVIADGQPIPRGGGQYLVGKPYTIAGQTYYPSEKRYAAVGLASWYGEAFHGRRTANGEIYDREAFSAAHPTMPLPSFARVTNLHNNYSMIVRVNDRGPFHSNRIMDVSHKVAQTLQFDRSGTGRVKVEYIGPASLAGSDDNMLLATLRTDGPARLPGETPEVRMAEAAPPPQRAPLREARIDTQSEPSETPRHVGLRPPIDADEDDDAPPPVRRTAASPERHVPEPPARDIANKPSSRDATRMAALVQAAEFLKTPAAKSGSAPAPKARPLDLATIPGAGVPIGARQHQASR
jgi:rare lipoprotein A